MFSAPRSRGIRILVVEDEAIVAADLESCLTSAGYQVIGVASPELVEKMVPAHVQLGTKHALVVHGMDGTDEISITGQSLCSEVKTGNFSTSVYRISPEDFGLRSAPLESIEGGTVEENAETILEIFAGAAGPKRDVVVLNAAAGLVAGSRVETLGQGVALAQEIIDRGYALAKLKQLIEFTQKLTEN